MTPVHEQRENVPTSTIPVYLFPKGLPGFDQLREFTLQEHNEVFSLLSAVDQPEVSFITVNPFDFITDYEFALSDDTILDIGIVNRDQVSVRCIVTWHSDRKNTTINLLAPIIFNIESYKAKQIVLQNTPYTTKHPLWTAPARDNEGGDS
ncbi:flagellar assembly protein FliW [Paenibacillus sp. S150]|uniref:flagellar assembly protein FliW n=1 Tax=Paenibacillus sp. S150 TaxID=2749826 RepID=UPI001C56AE7F|nr:flagellar assembly protein FliW [Paenibacillus sp. S150]MBW4081669.1 flagellar assembly protein FliW [Paenibacillus sp. S150]